MKKRMLFIISSLLLFIVSCQKETETPAPDTGVQKAGRNNEFNGHLQQTKVFSSESVLKWIDMQLRLIRSTAIAPPMMHARFYGYIGLALYESVVPGMPAYRSLSGQLSNMLSMPATEPGFAYHWPTSANAALAFMNRNFYSTTSAANKTAIDSLENALNAAFQQETNPAVFSRSVDFGKAVAQAVFNWAQTDGVNATNPVYAPPGLQPNAPAGLWIPTPPNFPGAAGPYWGKNRTIVPGSLDGSAPPAFMAYSTNPSSDYYKAQQEVYTLSQNLTAAQIAQAAYYRDAPGYPGGAHYVAILGQVLQKEETKLDKSALAFVQTGIAVSDALVGCWKVKYEANIERPITYIRNVLGHPGWNAQFNTPGHPDYPSGHSTGAGAFEVMMTGLFGENYQFTNRTYDYLGMPPQSYASFSELSAAIGMSRVYGGIHTRFACEEGTKQGKKIAQNILNKVHFLK